MENLRQFNTDRMRKRARRSMAIGPHRRLGPAVAMTTRQVVDLLHVNATALRAPRKYLEALDDVKFYDNQLRGRPGG